MNCKVQRNILLKENTPTAIASKMQDFKESNKEASDLEMEEKAASVSSRTFADTRFANQQRAKSEDILQNKYPLVWTVPSRGSLF